MNFKKVSNFITESEKQEIMDFVGNHKTHDTNILNDHIKEINMATNGWSVLYDMTQTSLSKEISQFQGDSTQIDEIPEIFHLLAKRISEVLTISSQNVFFQCIYLGANGEVRKHYDAGRPGYLTYKCNVFVEGPESDVIYVDDSVNKIEKLDLYCFEANLYKHWMDKSDKPRIHLSYGFLIPYDDFGWYENHPRIRLSNRIWQNYIKGK